MKYFLTVLALTTILASDAEACGRLRSRLFGRRNAQEAAYNAPAVQVTVQRQKTVQRVIRPLRASQPVSVQNCPNGQCPLR